MELNELRPEYSDEFMKSGERGKYYKRIIKKIDAELPELIERHHKRMEYKDQTDEIDELLLSIDPRLNNTVSITHQNGSHFLFRRAFILRKSNEVIYVVTLDHGVLRFYIDDLVAYMQSADIENVDMEKMKLFNKRYQKFQEYVNSLKITSYGYLSIPKIDFSPTWTYHNVEEDKEVIHILTFEKDQIANIEKKIISYYKLSVVAENKFWISDTEGHLVLASQDPYEIHSLKEGIYYIQFSIKGEKHRIELIKDLEINESHLQ